MKCPSCERNVSLARIRCPACTGKLHTWYVVMVLVVAVVLVALFFVVERVG
jgi:hypothetical protein